jgi:poly-gamma-glutamate capsule biosynthesis protein CapA/YwtB (metallophosphatase superfamily)
MTDTLSIAVGGDIFPDDYFYDGESPKNPEFSSTLGLLHSADLRFGNFETPLSERGRPVEKLVAVRSHPKVAADFARLGFDLVSLANNHVCDYGPLALADTIQTLDDIGVEHVGAGESLEAAVAPTVLERKGLKVGFIAFTCLGEPGSVATAERPGVAAIRVHSGFEVNPLWQMAEPGEPMMVTIRTRVDEEDCQAALSRIQSLRREVDILCVSVHWGYGASAELAEYQRPLAHALVDAGVDAVLGNHVHDVQGIEIYKGAPILYSPGTLLGGQAPIDFDALDETARKLYAAVSPDGYLARLDFGDGRCEVEIVPTSIDEHGLPIIARDGVLDRIVDRISRHSAELGTPLALRQGTLVPAP